ncbi:hypothetical protein JCM1841_003063 [Sporobolomyces salmonicolor]
MSHRPPPEASTSRSNLSSSPTRYGPDPLPARSGAAAAAGAAAAGAAGGSSLRQPPSRGGSGSSVSSGYAPGSAGSRNPSPSREFRDKDGIWRTRTGSGDSADQDRGTNGAAGYGSSGKRNTAGYVTETSDPGLAGRGAGGAGLGMGHTPLINAHLRPSSSSGLLSPSVSSSASSSFDTPHQAHRTSLLAHPKPLNLASSSSPSTSHRQTPSPTFPSSTASSTSSLRSAGPNQTTQQPHPHPSSSSHQPPSRPGSSSSHSHYGTGSQNHSSSVEGHGREGESDRDRDRRRGHSGGSSEGGAKSGKGVGPTNCAKCDLPMTGQFVRALGTVYHLDCFRCQDCNKIVAAKFFPIDSPDGSGRQLPLCETDYFRRLNLLCSKCGAALRGSYITALDMKFHVEHFTCSVCPTVFGPQDSYYEHAGSVYCHFHYSTRFAVKCTGCRTAILKQFVEINRNSIDEHWHPECYMIHKFWNIKLAPAPKSPEALPPPPSDVADQSKSADPSPSSTAMTMTTSPPQPDYVLQEETETPASLKARQKHMEEQVYRIWTILSAFEESSAACISEMLRHVSSGHYMEGVRMAEKFVLHVETLFAAIDDLNAAFRAGGSKEMSHVREARMLCKKVVNFFMLLSHTHETGARKMSITQELLSLVTGLAHYLKILIRIALTGSLKLERDYGNTTSIGLFLARLDRLARDPEANRVCNVGSGSSGNGSGSRKHAAGPTPVSTSPNGLHDSPTTVSPSNKQRPYGYKSLTRAVGTLVGQGEATTDLCEGCRLTVEEECARLGTSIRWHLPCLKCTQCARVASKDPVALDSPAVKEEVHMREFVWVDGPRGEGQGATYCAECARRERGGSLEGTSGGFEYVTRLEQYAFLLCVALNKLYGRLKQRGVVPGSPYEEMADGERSLYDTYRDSTDIKRMKSVQLDRKLSSTTARIPKRSTVVQSPSGRTAQSDDSTFSLFQTKPPVPSRKDQPLVDPIRGTVIPRPALPSIPSSSSAARPIPQEASTQPSPRAVSAGTPISSPPLLASANPFTSPQSQHAQPRPSSREGAARPPLYRATTAVHIVDEQPPDLTLQQEGPVLGGALEPTQDEEGITLADLPKVMEAEQKRAEQRRYFPNKLLSELSALEYFIVKHVAAVLLASETSALRDVAPLDDLLEIIDARKNTFWGKLFKGGTEKKSIKKKGVFGIPLEILVERNGADSMHGAGPGSLRIPSFVDDVISAMKQMDMSIEGIFRKNGNIRRLKDLSEALDRDSGSVNLSDDNPVQLAALLKKFLRDLPDPLMTFKLFHLFIAAQRIEDTNQRKKVLHFCCCLMPKAHRDTMEVLFVFLKWVASFSHVDEETGSKMDLQNLATVISPNILYAKGKDPARDESFTAARAVHELLELQDEFWEVPTECLSILNDQELFANPSQLTSKEILARAENHVRLNGRGAGWKGGVSITRGEASPPQRPGLQEAWSAPAVPGSRPISTSVAPSSMRQYQERPVSFVAANAHPLPTNGAPSPSPSLIRSGPGASPYDQHSGRHEGSSHGGSDRRGASESAANASSSSLPPRGPPGSPDYASNAPPPPQRHPFQQQPVPLHQR